MNIIIDTHIFLLAVSEPERLGGSRRAELETPANRVYVSAVSITEIMIKASLGKLVVNFDTRGYHLMTVDQKFSAYNCKLV